MAEVIRFPSFDAYQAALQHPERCFGIGYLKNGQLEQDLWGFPRVRSGGFALTYRVFNGSQSYAVRCFHKESQDRGSRYQAISQAIGIAGIESLIETRYIPQGVKVGQKWYPITVMPWIEGETLESYVQHNAHLPGKMANLIDAFRKVLNDLRAKSIAHGDLSHQNIIVRQDKLFLVDYDGMFVNKFIGKASSETGHSNFQHPGRGIQNFDIKLDQFSSIVIYLALKALTINPDLVKKYESSGDGLLFRKADFLKPYESNLLQELETYASIRKLVVLFRSICNGDVSHIPDLESFVSGNHPDIPRAETDFKDDKTQTSILDGSQRFQLTKHVGKVVTVIGQVKDVFQGTSKDGHAHLFLNFGDWRTRCFTCVLWGEAYEKRIENGILPQNEFVDKWLSITGVLTSYKRRPQIAIDTLYGIEVLEDETAAENRLGRKLIQDDTLTRIPTAPKTITKLHTLNLEEKIVIADDHEHKVSLDGLQQYEKSIQARIDELYSRKSKSDS